MAVAIENCLEIDIPDVDGTPTCGEAIMKFWKTNKKFACEVKAFFTNHGEYPEGCEEFLPKVF